VASPGTPSILKRRRRSSTAETPSDLRASAAKRIKFATEDSVGACVDPVFSDSDVEEDAIDAVKSEENEEGDEVDVRREAVTNNVEAVEAAAC
jgi:hypothetical protein